MEVGRLQVIQIIKSRTYNFHSFNYTALVGNKILMSNIIFSENVKPGIKFARKYFDSIEKMMHKDYGQQLGLSSTQHLMNLHNNKAGRLVSSSELQCFILCFCLVLSIDENLTQYHIIQTALTLKL